MQNLGFVIFALVIVAGFYGFQKNPQACRKLGDDLRTDLTAIYTPETNTPSASSVSAAPAAQTTVDTTVLTPVASAAPVSAAPVASPASLSASSPAVATPVPLAPMAPAPASPPRPATASLESAPPGTPVRVDEFTDYNEGVSAARAKNKLVLLHFTGSDWCFYCQKLDQEVLSTPNWADFVGPNFVVITLDFPRQKPLDDESSATNAALQSKFHIDGFPTLIVMTSDEKELGRSSGYNPGSGPGAVIAEIKKLASNH